ncbi:hypothetical protein ANCDUO_25511, partial [Ancylostoma duodenale]
HEASAMSRGSPAINCYFEAARIENETRARKYIARILWTAKHVIACGIFSAVGLDQASSAYDRIARKTIIGIHPCRGKDSFCVSATMSKGRHVPTLPDDHRNAALCKVLEKACVARLTDVRMWNRLLCGFSTMREFWVERHLRYASQLKDEIL